MSRKNTLALSERKVNALGTPLAKKTNSNAELHDSGFISPPTLVKFESTPGHPYNLRQPSRWSSTPLPSAETSSLTTPALIKASSASNFAADNSKAHVVEILDFNKRLDAFDQPEYDSGFESILNDQSSSCTPDVEKIVPRTCKDTSLGAIPKRRSPRIRASAIVKLDEERRRGGKLNLETKLNEEDNNVGFSLGGDSLCSMIRSSKEGIESLDIVRQLCSKDLSHVIATIYSYLMPEDLCKVSQVSQIWRSSLQNCSVHEERRLEYLARMKIERENFGVALTFTNKRISPRRILREVVNIKNGSLSPTNSAKRDRNPSVSAIVSPSKIRHKLFVDQAKTLTPGERLVHCPLCTSPSRVSIVSPPDDSQGGGGINLQSHSKAECSSAKCQFLFCPDCHCQEHPGQSCRARSQSTRATRAGGVSSKKSKARLRRL